MATPTRAPTGVEGPTAGRSTSRSTSALDRRRRGIARGLYESLFALLELQGYVNAYAPCRIPTA
ncbi:hypothetical protein [Halalkalicoccus salilacus]|uniref:hypothetical protein n=1 Tax=Halalkalicoccus salilacus TaxID=3117459 RepID=UPI00300EA419